VNTGQTHGQAVLNNKAHQAGVREPSLFGVVRLGSGRFRANSNLAPDAQNMAYAMPI
jgi:hypothetical protein